MATDNKPKPLSISLPPDVIARLDSRAEAAGKTRSAVLADDLTAYAELLATSAAKGRDPDRLVPDTLNYYSLLALGLSRAKKTLTRAEAMLILDVQNGSWVDGSLPVWLSGGLAHQVADGCTLDGLDAKWGVDGQCLVEKIKGMPDIEVLGILDWAAQFWGKDHAGEDDPAGVAVSGFLEE